MTAGPANAADLVTAEVTNTTTSNDVTVTQGSSTTGTINLTATGSIACLIIPSSPATATLETRYALDAAANVTASTPSSPISFFGNGVVSGRSTNCGTTWVGAPTPYSVCATFSAAADTPVGGYEVQLQISVTNPSVRGGKLDPGTTTVVTVHVVAPVVAN